MSPESDASPTVDATASLVLCQLSNGNRIVTTLAACEGTPGATVVAKGALPQGTLIVYRLPSGNEVVGTVASYAANCGQEIEESDPEVTTPAGDGSQEFFICKLPSGAGVISTCDECSADGGTIVAKLLNRKSKYQE